MDEPQPRPPRVTVVIPVKDRRQLLAAAIEALAAQTYADFEVVVVDDGSTDGSGALAATRSVHGRPVRVLPGGDQGAVHARQVGVAAARGEVLAFTDSDCRPAPEWLERAVAALDAGADAVNGLTRPTRPVLPLERSMGSGTEGLYPTCNMVYRRSAFERAGGFDATAGERWGFRADRSARGDGFGEDTLLAWRLRRAGGRVEHVPDAVVEHAVLPPDGRELLSRTLRVAAFPALVREVPELRATPLLRWGWQLGSRSRLPVYALAAAAAGGHRRLGLLCLGWWAGARLAELRAAPVSWRRRAAVLPVEMAVDALTAGALVAGSIRARRVTL